MPDVTTTLIGQLGIAAVFVLLYLRSMKRSETQSDAATKKCDDREVAMTTRIQKLEDYHRDTLAPLVEESNRTRDKQSEALDELTKAVRETRGGSGPHRTMDR